MMNDPGRQYEYYTFIVVPKVDDPFGRVVFAGCEFEAVNLLQEGERIRCLYLPPPHGNANATEQANLIRDVATYPEKYVYNLSKVVGMIVSVLDEKVTGEAINYATNRNISVITFDSDAPQSTRLAYVGVNNSDVGDNIGKEMMIEDPRGGHYAIITGIGPNHELRIEAIRQALRGSTWVESRSPLNCYENSTLALELLSDLLNNSTIQGIILTEAWPTYLHNEFYVIRETLSAKILVMGGYQSFAYYDVPSYIISFGSNPEEIGKQSFQLLLNTTETKQSAFPSLYTGYDAILRKPTVWIGFKGYSEIFPWGAYSDDVWKGCVNKGISCDSAIYTNAYDQAKAIVGASRFSACIAVSVLDENVTSEAIDIAVDRGVRVVTFESDAPLSKRSAYVGVNDFDYGVILGEKMKEKARKSKQPLGQQYVIITDQAPNSKLRINGIRAALKDSGWVEGEKSPSYVSYVEELQELAENPDIDGLISTEGWPMDNATFYRKFNELYGSKKTIIVGGRSSTQQALFDEGVVDELIGPSPVLMGLNIIDMCDRTQHILKPQYLNIEANFQGIYIDHISLGALSALGYVLFSIISLVSISLIFWTLKNRTSRPVQASQPFFMTMLCIGSIIMASAMIPMSIDDQQSQNSADIACMSIPWLLSVGFCTIFSALFSKTWRLVKIVESAARFRRITVTVKDVLYPFFGLLVANIIILTCWTTIDPLVFRRQLQDAALSSVGRCLSSSVAKGGATPYLVTLAAVNGSMLILANWMAYRSRKVHLEFSESKYIAFVMFSILQAFLVGIPLLCAVLRDPVPYYIVLLMLDFIICCSTLCFMFIPKMLAHRKKLSRRDGTNTSATAKESVENKK